MSRMTQTSKANILAADRAELVPLDDGGHGVKVWRGDKAAFVSHATGPIAYPTATLARRAVKRLRPDLEPTTI